MFPEARAIQAARAASFWSWVQGGPAAQALRRVIGLDRPGRGVVREREAPPIEKNGRRRFSAHRDRRRPAGMGT